MRAAGMQVLTDQIKAKRPGVTIYGIGDDAHKTHTSGHNEDDTAGVSAEDQDSDSTPEHRAIDVMCGSSFSDHDGDRLVNDLTFHGANQARLIYINWKDKQYHRKNGFKPADNSDDYHDHVHVSGEADADANTEPWILSDWNDGGPGPIPGLTVDGELGSKTITRWQQIMGTPADGVISTPYSDLVAAVQRHLNSHLNGDANVGLAIDGTGIFQNNKKYKTAEYLQRYLKSPIDGIISDPVSKVIKALQNRLNEGRF